MVKTFPIDFIRQAIEQKLFEEHIKDPIRFGGTDQVSILSFYEQLQSQDEVNRFVETYRDLTEQQNRTGLILNGVLVSPENPSITNLYSSMIIPMSFTCSMRCTLANRDQSIETINNLIETLKGRKVDIAQLKCMDEQKKPCYKPFVVGTIGQVDGAPALKNGDYIGQVNSKYGIADKIGAYFTALELSTNDTEYLYCENDGKLKVIQASKGSKFEPIETTILGTHSDSHDRLEYVTVKFKGGFQYSSALAILYNENDATITINFDDDTTRDVDCTVEITKYEYVNGYPELTVKLNLKTKVDDDDIESVDVENCDIYYRDYDFIENDGTNKDILFPPEHESFEKYKLSFSFDAVRCDEPRNLNGNEYCEISFGGSSTLVSEKVRLGNDLLKIGIYKYGIRAKSNTIFSNPPRYYLEPLEMPSGNNVNTQISQLVSNKFKTNTHSDAISLTLQYTFIADMSIPILKQWFDYARYGKQGISVNDISPNMTYCIAEFWSSWGEYTVESVGTKIVENIDIENTESDVLTLSLTMQIQGDNY